MQADWVRTAHADAWEEHGRFRASVGGGTARLSGVRLMASGLPHAQWNSGDVRETELVDIAAVRAWYAARPLPSGEALPWGLRVPSGASWPHGRKLFTKRLMGLVPDRFTAAAPPPDVTLRQAAPQDVDAVLGVDTVAFHEDDAVERPWVEPILSMPSAVVCVAELDGAPVGCGHCVVSSGDAGPAVYVAGIAVLPSARARGIGAAMSTWLVERGFAADAQLAHLHPDTDAAARIYARLGFDEVDGLDIYVDC
ncbi:MAG: GNAT family N-acetyltransferase [Frankiales bacterium]|nr:GNAT family N-acetyltransferase [Frankiales bacterium]